MDIWGIKAFYARFIIKVFCIRQLMRGPTRHSNKGYTDNEGGDAEQRHAEAKTRFGLARQQSQVSKEFVAP
ncbi:BQ5605_C004g03043 [Microbotryum silenes-dioicae]|uniref:BQ5605_C004g03043 protein n=1 Tax=Microbotryum silenes-dioicae TaxID=796604 RepID=A0A2X0M9N7_9BASI|nr:BQ5605_C004g03043 [Microbotryum silenes-dioicae]